MYQTFFGTISIYAIHHDNKIFFPRPFKPSIPSTWKNIISITKKLVTLYVDLCSSIHSILRNGDKLKFWWDISIGNSPLGEQFPTIPKLHARLISPSMIVKFSTIGCWNGISLGKKYLQLEEEHKRWHMCKMLLDTMVISGGSDEWSGSIPVITSPFPIHYEDSS